MVYGLIQSVRAAAKYRGGWKGLFEHMYTVRRGVCRWGVTWPLTFGVGRLGGNKLCSRRQVEHGLCVILKRCRHGRRVVRCSPFIFVEGAFKPQHWQPGASFLSTQQNGDYPFKMGTYMGCDAMGNRYYENNVDYTIGQHRWVEP